MISAEKVFYAFDEKNSPVQRIVPPATVEIQTQDCFSNQLRDPGDTLDQLDWDCINPATGPIYVEGAEPGDTLKVTIESIDLDDQGTVCVIEGEGVLGHMISGNHIRVAPIVDDKVQYLDLQIPTKKMIGVIGVAPEGSSVNNGTPGKHGGNMDTIMITEGAKVYFPVGVEGALFGLGDCHGVMGDGEIGVSALECAANVRVTLELIKGKAPEYPLVENDQEFGVIVSKETVDEAIVVATELMCKFLEERMTGYSREEIIMLMSMVGDVRISQVVDPEKTVRFVFPKAYAQGITY